MTKAEEANVWARIVALEKRIEGVDYKVDSALQHYFEGRQGKEAPVQQLEETVQPPDPPRDRYGMAVGRPDM